METVGQLVIIVVLTFLEGVFVAAEIALVTMRRTPIEQLVEEGSRSARRVQRLIAQPGRFLAVTQIGLTFLGFLASAYAAVSLTRQLQTLLQSLGADRGWAEPLSLVIVTLLLALFTIVFGELVPKSLALAHPERFALTLAGPIDVLGRILSPVVALLTGITRAVTRLIGVDISAEAQIT